jgi:hypothetical protein
VRAVGIYLTFIFLTVASGQMSAAEIKKRIGVIDLESSELSPAQKKDALGIIRTRLAARNNWYVISTQEVENKLMQASTAKAGLEKILREQSDALSEVEREFEKGKNLYLSSRFDEAIHSFEGAFEILGRVSLVLKSPLPIEILKYLAASTFFQGDQSKAKNYLEAALALDPAFALEADRFPPPLLELLGSLHGAHRDDWEKWEAELDGDTHVIRASFLGVDLNVAQENKKISLSLPKKNSIFQNQVIVLNAEGSVPQSFALASLPTTIHFESTEPKRRPTTGLFIPIHPDQTPSAELKWFQDQLQASLLFLGAVSKDSQGSWLVRVQTLESRTNRLSAIASSASDHLNVALEQAVDQLLLSSNENSSHSLSPVGRDDLPAELSTQSKPFYKTWWFWTVAGAGLVGAGVGAFVLLNQKESLAFEMRAQ